MYPHHLHYPHAAFTNGLENLPQDAAAPYLQSPWLSHPDSALAGDLREPTLHAPIPLPSILHQWRVICPPVSNSVPLPGTDPRSSSPVHNFTPDSPSPPSEAIRIPSLPPQIQAATAAAFAPSSPLPDRLRFSLPSNGYPAPLATQQHEHAYPSPQLPGDPLQYYVALPLQTFPTPSELLSEHSLADPTPFPAPVPAPPPLQPSRETGYTEYSRFEPQRKLHHRAVAHSLGFTPTDPDSISSHDKKRHYLECLEQYVVYLHEQLRIIGAEPLPLERVSTYRGLSSRSIRTLLVNMEDNVRKLHLTCLQEEKEFVTLREMVLAQEALAGDPLTDPLALGA